MAIDRKQKVKVLDNIMKSQKQRGRIMQQKGMFEGEKGKKNYNKLLNDLTRTTRKKEQLGARIYSNVGSAG